MGKLVKSFRIAAFVACSLVAGIAPAATIEEVAAKIQDLTPENAADLSDERSQALKTHASELHLLASAAALDRSRSGANQWLATTRGLLVAKNQVDQSLSQTLEIRRDLASIEDEAQRRETIRQFLVNTSTLIDLSGRLRYALRDAIGATAHHCASDRAKRLELLDLLIEYKSGVGAGVMAVLLEDPPENSRAQPADNFVKGKVLVLLAVTEESDLLPRVAKFIRDEDTSPSLLVMATECVRRMGLPQSPHPDQAAALAKPAIEAEELHQWLSKVDPDQLSARSASHRVTLLKWLESRKTHGVTEDEYRFFGHKVREGDWLLMRNPSPYNLFTDLSPGLFTHVGVVTTDVDEAGIRRFVIVDLPERGAKIPVANVDAYILDTLHYFFVRHADVDVAAKMGETARAMIGNPSQFDLNFDTSRVAAYRDGELRGRNIHTYCAGFLLICAMRSGAPLTDFFPIREQPAAGNTQKNLQALGLSIGDDFVSPTAALFSPKLEIVGRRRPMYDPAREVQEAVYDHFAQQMMQGTMHPSPDALQALREKLAQVSESNIWLRRALARASGVSEQMDLASAAKAAAVVETLDDIAERNRDQFIYARTAFLTGNLDSLRTRGVEEAKIQQLQAMRVRHAELYRRWQQRQLPPHQLQSQLVDYYAKRGREQLDERFFTSP